MTRADGTVEDLGLISTVFVGRRRPELQRWAPLTLVLLLALLGDMVNGALVAMSVVFTDTGENKVADILDGTVAVPTYYIGQGTGTTDAAKGDTALETASAESRSAATLSQPSANINRFVATIVATGTRAITEAGLFDASTTGILIIRGVFSAINVVTSDSIEFTINLTWS